MGLSMRKIDHYRVIALLAVFLPSLAMGFPGSGQGQPSAKPTAPNQSGVWHHFGPGADSTHAAPGKAAPRPNASPRLAEMERQMQAMVNHDRLNPAHSLETKGGHAP